MVHEFGMASKLEWVFLFYISTNVAAASFTFKNRIAHSYSIQLATGFTQFIKLTHEYSTLGCKNHCTIDISRSYWLTLSLSVGMHFIETQPTFISLPCTLSLSSTPRKSASIFILLKQKPIILVCWCARAPLPFQCEFIDWRRLTNRIKNHRRKKKSH